MITSGTYKLINRLGGGGCSSLRLSALAPRNTTKTLRSYCTSNKYKLSEPFNYESDKQYAAEQPLSFWDEIATKYVHWNKKYDQVMGGNETNPEWYKGGMLNMCNLALDVNVKNPVTKNQLALIQETPVKGIVHKLTYEELWEQVCLFARALQNLGVQKGDRVVIYMPMINHSVIAMLACARLGATHSVVFGGFASPQLATRIDHCKPKVVVSANFGVEGYKFNHYTTLLEKALQLCQHKPDHVVVYNRTDCLPDTPSPPIPNALDWELLIKGLQPLREYTLVETSHPLYILYTSGTTGNPKGIVRDTGGYAVALNYAMRNCFGLKQGDVFFGSSDVGWVVGHTVSVYGPLMAGITSIIFEGKPVIPDAGVYYKIIEKYRAKGLFSAPTAIRAIHRDDPDGKLAAKYDLSSLIATWLGGERLDAATYNYLTTATKRPVLDSYWSSESGWPMITNPSNQIPVKVSCTGKPVPGYQYHVLNPKSEHLDEGQIGELCVKLPVPPGFVNTLYLNHEGYKQAYLNTYPGYMRTADSGYYDKDGYFYVMSRVDDIINVSGHRLSTGAIEEVITAHPKVVECAVIGIHDDIKGEVPFGLVVLKPQFKNDQEQVERDLIQSVREVIGPVATFKKVISVSRLPKTRSGKILRNILRKMYNKEEYTVPPTIEDMEVLKEIQVEYDQYQKSLIEQEKEIQKNHN